MNVGCGTITCNYDGEKKHPTRIGDGVFVGSDSILVAPISIGKGAYVAAGSTLTENVAAGALALGRARQVNKNGWARKRRAPAPKRRHHSPRRARELADPLPDPLPPRGEGVTRGPSGGGRAFTRRTVKTGP